MTNRRFPASSLTVVLVLGTVFLMLFLAVFSFFGVLQAQASREVRLRQAIALGNGGINHALSGYRANPNYRVDNYSLGTGEVSIVMTSADPDALVTVHSYVPNRTDPHRICRSFQARFSTPEQSTAPRVVAGSYRESSVCKDLAAGSGGAPPANSPPALTVFRPDGDTVPQGALFPIRYSLVDDTPGVYASFYLDTNNSGFGGSKISGECALAIQGEYKNCLFDTTPIPPGVYYVYGVADDGSHSATQVYAPGSLTITSVTAPQLTIQTPQGVSADTVLAGANYGIIYNLTDPDSIVTGKFYSDNDRQNYDGTAIATCQDVVEGQNLTCQWNTSGLTAGKYYVYGIADDGDNPPVKTYSPGALTITTDAPPSLAIAKPDGVNDTIVSGDTYSVIYSLSDNSPITAAFYYDVDQIGFNGTALPGPCATAPAGISVGCAWNTAGMAAGSYYVYGVANDGINPSTRTYSSGPITVQAAPSVNIASVLTIAKPNGRGDQVLSGAMYSLVYSLFDPDDVVTASFYTDSDNKGYNGTALTGRCAAAPEASLGNCAFATNGLSLGDHYVYGIASDGTRAYSPGPLTVVAAQCADGRDNDGDGKIDLADPGCDNPNDNDETDPPVANSPPNFTISQPDGISDSVSSGATYSVVYTLSDSDSVATASFYYDTNSSGYDGTVIVGCQNAPEGAGATCGWNTAGLAAGTYYVYGMATDRVNPEVKRYAPGPMTIQSPPANQSPTLTISQPDGVNDSVEQGTDYAIAYSLNDPDNTVTATFYYDTDRNASNGVGPAVGGACGAALESATTCAWATNGVQPGRYYIYGETSDGINSVVKAYSPGVATITVTPPPPPPLPQCVDGRDNDGDGKIDYPADPGCTSRTDNDETDAIISSAIVNSLVRDATGALYAVGAQKRVREQNCPARDLTCRSYSEELAAWKMSAGGVPCDGSKPGVCPAWGAWATPGRVVSASIGNAVGYAAVLDASRNLYIVGTRNGRSAVWKYTSGGQLDAAFGGGINGGIVLSPLVAANYFQDIAISADGSTLYIAGLWRDAASKMTAAVVKLTTGGIVCDGAGGCPAWGNATPRGLAVTNFTEPVDLSISLALTATNEVLIGGTKRRGDIPSARQWYAAKFTPAGQLDPAFGVNGAITYTSPDGLADWGLDLALHNGAIYLAGLQSSNNDSRVRKYSATTGALCGDGNASCPAWGNNGSGMAGVIISFWNTVGRALGFDASSNLYALGWSGVSSLTPAGVVRAWAQNGTLLTQDRPLSLVTDASGAIWTGGWVPSSNDGGINLGSVRKYTAAGVLDFSFGRGGVVLLDTSQR